MVSETRVAQCDRNSNGFCVGNVNGNNCYTSNRDRCIMFDKLKEIYFSLTPAKTELVAMALLFAVLALLAFAGGT